MGPEKLYNFMDENIPKIENSRPVEKKENKLSTETLLNLQEMLNNKSLTPEQTNQILSLLQGQLKGNNTEKKPDFGPSIMPNTIMAPIPNVIMPPIINTGNIGVNPINPHFAPKPIGMMPPTIMINPPAFNPFLDDAKKLGNHQIN